jgi:tetratricopeptide (TPR) repeat protein
MGKWPIKNVPVSVWVAVAVCVLFTASPARADYIKAVQYYKQGQFDKALQELKPDLDKSPDWEPGHRLAGLCYLYLKNNALAISEFARAVQLKSKEFSTYQGLALAYLNSDKVDNCIQSLQQGEQFAKESADLYILHHVRGAAYFRQQKYDQAIDDLTGAIRIKATDWADYYQLGVSYYNMNRYDEALQALLKALSIKPGDSSTTGYLGKIYLKQGASALSAKQYSQALDLLTKAGTYTPSDGSVFYNMGEAYLFLNKYPEAEKAYTQALTLLPGNVDVLQRLGLVYERQKKWDRALNAYQKAYESNPSPSLKDDIARMKDQIKNPDQTKKKKLTHN